jgi:hypothetical protein
MHRLRIPRILALGSKFWKNSSGGRKNLPHDIDLRLRHPTRRARARPLVSEPSGDEHKGSTCAHHAARFAQRRCTHGPLCPAWMNPQHVCGSGAGERWELRMYSSALPSCANPVRARLAPGAARGAAAAGFPGAPAPARVPAPAPRAGGVPRRCGVHSCAVSRAPGVRARVRDGRRGRLSVSVHALRSPDGADDVGLLGAKRGPSRHL